MKKGLKIVIGIVICIYLAIVVFTTGFLLSKNDYGVSQFLGRNIIVIEDDSLEPVMLNFENLMIKYVLNII